MIVIICTDNHNGMMFNHRRQSQDQVLRQDIIQEVGDSRIWMNSYSYRQFSDATLSNAMIDEDFLNNAGAEEFCFLEDNDLTPYIHLVRRIIWYRWNRNYPADLYFNIDLSKWRMVSRAEFVGSSHDKITKEVYLNE